MAAISVGLVGYGSMGAGTHCDYYQRSDKFDLVAVCDVTPERLELAREKYGVRTYSDYAQFLADPEFDLILIATPSNSHAQMAVQALEAGKQVVVEKPMCLTTAEADQMIEAAQKSHRLLSVFQNRRWDSGYLTARQVVDDGVLGDLYMIKNIGLGYSALMQRYGVPEFRSHWRSEKAYGGGALYDFGPHHIDQIMLLADSPVVDVYGHLQSRLWSKEVDDGYLAILRFQNGIMAQAEMSMFSLASFGGFVIVGSQGAYKDGMITVYGEQGRTVLEGEEKKEYPATEVAGDWDQYYDNLYEVLTKGAELAVKPEQVREQIRVLEAVKQSSETGQVVRLAR